MLAVSVALDGEHDSGNVSPIDESMDISNIASVRTRNATLKRTRFAELFVVTRGCVGAEGVR